MSDLEKPPLVDAPASGDPDEVAALEQKEVDVGHKPRSIHSTSSTEHDTGSNTLDPELGIPRQNIDPEPYPPAIKVPISQRRGFLGKLAVLAEVENAYHYTRAKKWTITFIVALCGVSAPLASSIILRWYTSRLAHHRH